jgi:ADP-heptose:LPS heptosyltransferase
MSPNTIRIIDKWIGQPICFVLTCIRYCLPKRKVKEVKSVLFLKLIEQGATVLAYTAIQRAVKMVGKENVYFCVFSDNRPILDILNVVTPKNIIAIRNHNILLFLWDMLGMFIKVRKLGINSTVDMEFFSRATAIMAYLSGATMRVGLHRFNSEQPYRGDLLTHKVQYNPFLHTSKAYLALVKSLESDPNVRPLLKERISDHEILVPSFVPRELELKAIDELLTKKFSSNLPKRLLLLNPNASDMLPLRKWPTERFLELGNRLLSQDDVGIIITGAPSEQESCKQIANEFESDRVVSVAGETTLRELIVLYGKSDVLVTNDSGPGHFATLTNVKSLVLFGPETPQLFGPLGDRSIVIWKGLACSPCVNAFNHRFSPCNDNVCMQKIQVDEVAEKVFELLGK